MEIDKSVNTVRVYSGVPHVSDRIGQLYERGTIDAAAGQKDAA